MTHTLSIALPIAGILLIFFLLWLGRRTGWLGGTGWRYKKEFIEPLGKVDAAYERGKLIWYRLRKHDVLIEIICQNPESKNAGIEFVRSVSKEELDRYLAQAVSCIPESDSKAFGFDKEGWKIETVIIHGKDSRSFELGNSVERDHVALVVFENGRYSFEGIDG